MLKRFEKYIDKDKLNGIIKSLGLVFGDIGTSPIYTLTVVFLLTKPTERHVIGILSLIIWTLIIIVTVEYTWLAMSLGKKGEGGTIVLKEILVSMLKSGRKMGFVILLSYIGISLLFGDGVITPAISILSAVEGIVLIPGFEETGQGILVLIAVIIAISLFSVQKKGTDKIAQYFGPLMLLWFLSLTISGIISIFHFPYVFKAISPHYAIQFLLENGLTGFFVLSQVILCATGGEALFADMGQLGRLPIVRAWHLVFIALLFNYLGQGAFIISHPDVESSSVLFKMFLWESKILYVPLLILSIIATIIASQAMISGMFSIVYQGITTRVLPMLKIDYTSSELRSQIYIGTVNWILLFSVIFMMLQFQESSKLAAAYGLAVTGDMVLTGILITWIYYLKKNNRKVILSVFVTFVAIIFLISSFYKIPHGGYWSIILAAIPFSVIVTYIYGQKRLYSMLKPIGLKIFLDKYNSIYKNKDMAKIKGTALYFAKEVEKIPPYIDNIMFNNNIIYEDNVIVSIIKLDDPFGVESAIKGELADGLRIFEIKTGYMEIIDVDKLLKKSGINEKIIFYGIEDIVTDNIIWKVYSMIKKNTPAFVQFYELPSHKIHGVITRIEM